MPAWKPQKYDTFLFVEYIFTRGLETAKYPQIEAIGDRIEFWFAVECKIKWKNIFEATSCYLQRRKHSLRLQTGH